MPRQSPPSVQTFSATVVRDGPSCYVVLPFDPKAAFGTVRAPVVVTIDGYTFHSRVVAMGGPICVALRESHRKAARLEGGETVKVRVGLDTAPRTVAAPANLLRALEAVPGALDAWTASSYTHQREHVEAIDGAKKPETRERRVAAAVAMVAVKARTAKGPTAQTPNGTAATAKPAVTRRLAKKR